MDWKNAYIIDLKSSDVNGKVFHLHENDSFFEYLQTDIEHGELDTTITVEGTGRLFNLNIHTEGTVHVPCDRCLADMELRIDTTDDLVVKFGTEYMDEGDYVVVPEEEGTIDIAPLIYEFVALSMPIKRVHQPGECDPAMMEILNQHLADRSNLEDDSETTDEEDVEEQETE